MGKTVSLEPPRQAADYHHHCHRRNVGRHRNRNAQNRREGSGLYVLRHAYRCDSGGWAHGSSRRPLTIQSSRRYDTWTLNTSTITATGASGISRKQSQAPRLRLPASGSITPHHTRRRLPPVHITGTTATTGAQAQSPKPTMRSTSNRRTPSSSMACRHR